MLRRIIENRQATVHGCSSNARFVARACFREPCEEFGSDFKAVDLTNDRLTASVQSEAEVATFHNHMMTRR
jgi:hypothetical protein